MTLGNTLASLVFVVLASTTAVAAQTQTALKVGERVTGRTKQCVYQALGNEYTRTVELGQVCPPRISVVVAPIRTDTTPNPAVTAPVQIAATALKTGETTTGETKQCFYAALGQIFTRQLRSAEACPDSITVMVDSGCGRTGLETCARTDTSLVVTPEGS
jgi:hypothetical protein